MSWVMASLNDTFVDLVGSGQWVLHPVQKNKQGKYGHVGVSLFLYWLCPWVDCSM